jgi:hypothetical protein
MDDIVKNLRAAAAVLLEAPEHVPIRGGEVMLNLHKRADEMNAAADEIERLRLTGDEHEAVAAVTRNYKRLCDEYGPSDDDDRILATLQTLLERTKPKTAEERVRDAREKLDRMMQLERIGAATRGEVLDCINSIRKGEGLPPLPAAPLPPPPLGPMWRYE